MAKKRKTREQKKLADSRHNVVHTYSVANTPNFKSNNTISIKSEAKTKVLPQNAYPYLKKDLSKTAILTFGILLFQIALFVILKNHIFIIPGINY